MLHYKQILLGLWLLLSSSSFAIASTGQELALDPDKGNCQACHNLPGAEKSGNIGPSLQGIIQKFPDIKQLQAYLRDPALSNTNTIMPPYGRHKILTEDEIVTISKFIHTL